MKMHPTLPVVVLLLLMLVGNPLAAEPAQIQAGPSGGRVLSAENPVEFWVNTDRHPVITFLDASLAPVEPGERNARVTALAPDGRRSIQLDQIDNQLIGNEALPAGDGYVIVVQVFSQPNAAPQNFRIVYDEHVCGGCSLVEYACTCGH